ncbi:MAG TPA: ComF family protein [Candidatus Limnocylindrales bacterium]|nr:ComF family protein [Candidatus Limnocylindrales bacterium]
MVQAASGSRIASSSAGEFAVAFFLSFLVNNDMVIFRRALDALASVIFPAPCRVCGEALVSASRIPVCEPCLGSFERISEPMCQICGRPFTYPIAAQTVPSLCRLCRARFFGFDRARSYANYNDALGKAIVLLKYEEVKPLGRWFAERLADVVRNNGEAFKADVVVPVPLHPDRQRERGYNQAELIARPLASMLGIRLGPYLLVRKKPRPAKLVLSRTERWSSVRGAYATREGAEVDNLRVLLVDDVLTTGATLDACSRALKKAGAAEVFALTMGRVVSSRALSGPAQRRPSDSGGAN